MKRILKNILVLSASLIIFFIFFEIFLRAFLPQNSCMGDLDISLNLYRFAPNSKCTWRGYTNEFVVPIEINSAGYRDYSYNLTKPKNTIRIAVIGDSYVEALQVPIDKMFIKLLENKLNQNGKMYEVLGFGHSGIGTEQEKILLEKNVLLYAPDIVILAFTLGNDIRDNILFDQSNITISIIRTIRNILKPITTVLRINVHTFSFFIDSYRRIKNKLSNLYFLSDLQVSKNIYDYDFEIYFENYSSEINQAWNDTLRALSEMNNRAGQFTIFIIPTAFQVDAKMHMAHVERFGNQKYNLTKPIDILINFCDENSIPIINPLPALRANNTNNSFYWQYDGHINEAGHAIFADIIFDFLQDNNMLLFHTKKP